MITLHIIHIAVPQVGFNAIEEAFTRLLCNLRCSVTMQIRRERRRKKMKRILPLALMVLLCFPVSAMFLPTVNAQALATSSTSDPINDEYFDMSGSHVDNTWAMIDIVYAEISQIDSTHIQLLTRVNQDISLSNEWQSYLWLLDTGVPAPSWPQPLDSNDLTVSYYIGISWSASGPLWIQINKYNNTGCTELVHEDARNTPERYFSGDSCFITVPLSLLGNPASIKWVAVADDGIGGGKKDKAPNSKHVILIARPAVGGEWAPIDKLQLLAPLISLTAMVAAAASFVGVKCIKKRQS